MRTTAFRGIVLPLTAASAMLAGGEAALAADGSTQASGAYATTIEDVVVTARRREESAQTTPVSVTAVSPIALERANIQQPSNLNRLVAGLVTMPTVAYGAGFSAFIRGIGSSEATIAQDSPIGVYRDGVYQGKTGASGNADITTIERVEVLRGPQGTLFGRNTTGGAINFVTRSPRDEFGVTQRLRYGRFNEFQSITTVDTGEYAGLSALVTYQHRQRHGFVDDPNAKGSHDPGATNSESIFAKVRGEWGGLTATYIFDYFEEAGVTPAYQITAGSPNFRNYYSLSPGLGGAALPLSAERLDTLNLFNQPLQDNKIKGHALILEYRISDLLTLKSITSFRKFDAPELYFTITTEGLRGRLATSPTTVSSVGVYTTGPKYQHQRQFSQEVQGQGEAGPFNYTLGAFHFRETGVEYNQGTIVAVISPTLGFPTSSFTHYYMHNNSDAVYGQVSYQPGFLEGIELSGGLRYTKDIRRITQLRPTVRGGRVSFNNLNYMASAKMQFTPNVMAFARVGTAVRSGGFNNRAGAGQDFIFKPEKALSYEAGVKSQLFDNRLRLNAGVFYTKYRDLQITQITGVSAGGLGGQTFNANASYRGFELELVAKPVSAITLSANLGYVDPKYKEVFFVNPATGLPQNYADQAKFPYVPKWNGSLDALYTKDVGFGTASVNVNYTYVGKRRFHISNLANQSPLNEFIASPGFGMFNARASLGDIEVGSRVKMEVSLWVDNIANKEYRAAGIDFGSLGFGGNVFGPPRTYGVDLRFEY
jgi:iron complex outermembrane receptor protein